MSGWQLLLLLVAGEPSVAAPPHLEGATALAAKIDECVERHWRTIGVRPAEPADDVTFLRRATLDLAGRIPTRREAQSFAQDASADKRARAVRRLLTGPEFALHFANVLDDAIQASRSGDGDFLAWLRDSLQARRPWDQMFREVLLGPWDTPDSKRAERFLARRLANIDELTNDTSRAFFGVDVSCAKCHDHPLVDDWKQDHYFGLSSFFCRTYEFKGKDKERRIGEKDAGEIEFVTRLGEKRKAQLMFLSGQIVVEPPVCDDQRLKEQQEQAKNEGTYLPPAFSRREQLVRVALEQRTMISRSFVNRLWAYFLGRGLVEPVDQMHSANPPAVPGVLELLADDLAGNGYAVERLVAAICTSRVYALASHWPYPGTKPAPEQFALAPLRPLSPKQMAASLVLATGDDSFENSSDVALDRTAEGAAWAERHKQLESRGSEFVAWLDPRSDAFQSSTGEALFMSNHPAVQRLLQPDGRNLAARLAESTDETQFTELAAWTVFGRRPVAEELALCHDWCARHAADRATACRDLLWAMVTSAEFRFNH
ncbi:MAG TPA: DUF1549 domain-containing protein [Pirellulales bacterium]|jgi:hypothetical protein|nr:DUF1549 domain-containing protein [Pirellulales bacterium]